MESVLTSLSFWSIAAVLATTSRLLWEYFRPLSAVADFTQQSRSAVADFTQQSRSAFAAHYKAASLAGLAALVLAALQYTVLPQAFDLATRVLPWALCAPLLIWLGNGLQVTQPSGLLRIFFGGHPLVQPGALVIHTAVLLGLFGWFTPLLTWNAHAVLALLVSYALGGALATFVTGLLADSLAAPAADPHPMLTADRFDALVAATFAAAVLGATFADTQPFGTDWHGLGGTLLPLTLALTGALVSSLGEVVFPRVQRFLPPARFVQHRVITTGLLVVLALGWTRLLLPAAWVAGTVEYTRWQVGYALVAGLLGGLLLNKLVRWYEMGEKVLLEILYLKSFRLTRQDRVALAALRLVSGLAPLLLLLSVFWFAHQWVGLYGVCMAMVAMQANLRTKLTAEIAEIEKLIRRSQTLFFPD